MRYDPIRALFVFVSIAMAFGGHSPVWLAAFTSGHAVAAEPDDYDHDEDHDHDDHDEGAHDDRDHNEDRDEGDHDDHDHEEEGVIRLSPEEMTEFGIETGTAERRLIRSTVRLTGEVVLNEDRVAHIVPKVSGNVRVVKVQLGQRVVAGDVLAELESRELADAKASFVAARERAMLTESNYQRIKALWDQKITSEQEYLEARNTSLEAQIDRTAAQQKLIALDVSEQVLNAVASDGARPLTLFELKSPIDGEVIKRHAARGELIGPDETPFIVADLSDVWVDLIVYENQIGKVTAGQQVNITGYEGSVRQTGVVDYVSPVVDAATRTATARVILPNQNRLWRPGTFVQATVGTGEGSDALAVPAGAVQDIDGEKIVFVDTPDGFEAHMVVLGRSDGEYVEILSGLEPGDRLVTRNAFLLKAELGRSGLEHAGHVH